MKTNEEMTLKIQTILGKSYEWDGELYYRGNPLCDQNQTDTERAAVNAADMNGSDRNPHKEWPGCDCGFSWTKFAKDNFA